MTSDDEKKILELLSTRKGQETGFRLLLQKYGSQLYWLIRRIVVSHEDAEDAMQETAIAIYNKIGSFEGKSSLKTWIYRIATNEALTVLRRRCNFLQSLDSLGPKLEAYMETDREIDASSAEALFQKALLQLPTQQRMAFNLRYYDELAYEEIAEITGKNVNTLKTNYHFAVQKIKTYLKENTI